MRDLDFFISEGENQNNKKLYHPPLYFFLEMNKISAHQKLK